MKRGIPSLLKGELSDEEIAAISKSVDIIGDILILKTIKGASISEQTLKKAAKVILDKMPYVKVVLYQTTPVDGIYRVRRFKWLAGEKRTVTIHREYGCSFYTDVEKAYFSPRLSFERKRIADQISSMETVVNMFAGVGCYSVLIAKFSKAAVIYSIDINPEAFLYMVKNCKLNRVGDRVVPLMGDAAYFSSKLRDEADRVLMPLPSMAHDFLENAVEMLKPLKRTIIHFYDFQYGKSKKEALEKSRIQLEEHLKRIDCIRDFEIVFERVVRGIGPHWWQCVLDVEILKGS